MPIENIEEIKTSSIRLIAGKLKQTIGSNLFLDDLDVATEVLGNLRSALGRIARIVGITAFSANTIWVGPDGSDSNDGLTEETALLTVDRALELIGDIQEDMTVKIIGPSADEDGYSVHELEKRRNYHGSLTIEGLSYEVAGPFTVTGATFQTLTASGATWTEEQFSGATVRMTSGACDGQTRGVVYNSSSEVLYLVDGFDTANPSNGDTFELLFPNVKFDSYSTNIVGGGKKITAELRFVNIVFPNGTNFADGSFYFDSVVLEAGDLDYACDFQNATLRMTFVDGRNGLSWRKTGTVIAGTLNVYNCANYAFCGNLGTLVLNNSGLRNSDAWLKGRVRLRGRLSAARVNNGAVFQATIPTVYFNNYDSGNSIDLEFAFRLQLSTASVYLNTDAGALFYRFGPMCSLVTSVAFSAAEYVSLNDGAIAQLSGHNGGASATWAVDGVTYTSADFGSNNIETGPKGSVVYRG